MSAFFFSDFVAAHKQDWHKVLVQFAELGEAEMGEQTVHGRMAFSLKGGGVALVIVPDVDTFDDESLSELLEALRLEHAALRKTAARSRRKQTANAEGSREAKPKAS